ncbi:MAG: histone [Candidatus Hodarchaeota archaeon]
MEKNREVLVEEIEPLQKSSKRITGFFSSRIKQIIRESGAQRVSVSSINCLNEIVTEKSVKIAKKAVDITRHLGRLTVECSDIQLAALKEL